MLRKCKIFWADSGCAVKINNNKKNQCLAFPKDQIKPKAVWACRRFSQKNERTKLFCLSWKAKNQKKNPKKFVYFLKESMEHQSALGFIWPKDHQSFCEVQKKCHQIFSKKNYYIWIIQMFKKGKHFQKKSQLEVGAIAFKNMPSVPSMHRNSITMWSPKGRKKQHFQLDFFAWNRCIIWI